MSTTTDPGSEPLRVPLSDQLGLVERLRHEAWHTSYKPAKPWDLMVEAADEIERRGAALELAHTFINAAAGEGLVLDGVDAADLYVALFPERYAATIASLED